MDQSTLSRFLDKVSIDEESGCWIWNASTRDGYGCFGIDRIIYGAHRVSYEHFYDQIPDGLQVQHICNNRKCVNPYHLKLGNHQDNSDDKLLAGRQAKGETHGRAKLTIEDVKVIRQLAQDGKTSQCEIADAFGVSQCQISFIVRRKQWING